MQSIELQHVACCLDVLMLELTSDTWNQLVGSTWNGLTTNLWRLCCLLNPLYLGNAGKGATSRGGCLTLAQLELKAIVGRFNRTNNNGILIGLEIMSVGLVIASRGDCHFEVQNHSWDIKVIRGQGGDSLSFWSHTSTFPLMFIVEPWKMSIVHVLST